MTSDDKKCPRCGADLSKADRTSKKLHITSCTDPKATPSPADSWKGGRSTKRGGRHK